MMIIQINSGGKIYCIPIEGLKDSQEKELLKSTICAIILEYIKEKKKEEETFILKEYLDGYPEDIKDAVKKAIDIENMKSLEIDLGLNLQNVNESGV